ncbi:MAG: hypothetical protein QOK31_1271 [Solirubrobacteraceae bacterium]|nr:hypothetical protein [Solirubrobacteraceae bacterium]
MSKPALVLVTGASGALGQRVLAALRTSGWRTRATAHRRPVPGAEEAVPADVVDADAVSRAAAGATVIVHLAGRTHARRAGSYDAVNVGGTRNVVEAARRHAVGRLVHVSTRAISPAGGGYSRSKLRAEEVVRTSGVPHVILRLAEVYGAGGNEGLDDLVDRTRRGATVPLVGRGEDGVCPLFVEDAVAAIVAAAEAPAARGGPYTLAGDCTTVAEFARACALAFDSGSRVVGVPRVAVAAAAAVSRLVPLPVYPDQPARLRSPKQGASPEAAEDLGFAARPLRAGLALLAASEGGP